MNDVKIVVYDVDDVIIGLNESAHKIAGIDLTKRKYFDVKKETALLTTEQMKGLYRAYNDVETFKKAVIYRGAEDIFSIEDTNKARVYLHSLSYQQEIADYKVELLSKLYPDIPDDRIMLECGVSKSVINEVDILVEDCLDNIRRSKARIANIMIKKAYNRPENYGTTLKELRAIEVDNLEQANEVVRRLVLEA